MPAAEQTEILTTLSDLIAKNYNAFTANNVKRYKDLNWYGSPGFKKAFQEVPLLLQVNHQSLPGYYKNDDAPRGVWGFENTIFFKAAMQNHPDLQSEWRHTGRVYRPVVHSLFLMGSSGSIGHTSQSDLDYWVCIDRKQVDAVQWDLFHQKLDTISNWAQKALKTEVNFYPVDLTDLAANLIGDLSDDPMGQITPLFIKEEVYRTLLLVSGKTPLWCVLPAYTGIPQYKKITSLISQSEDGQIGDIDLIDLGFPLRPTPQEYMAAALWLSEKSEADPFKAVIKMILVLEQVEYQLKAPLMCEQVKSRILKSSSPAPVDPYLMTIRRILEFSREKLPPDLQDLVRVSVFFKIRGLFGKPILNQPGPKSNILTRLIKEWEWEQDKYHSLDGYNEWSERKRLTLGQEIKSLLFYLYSRIAQRLNQDFPDQIQTKSSTLNHLTSGLLKRYSMHEEKVEGLPSKLHLKMLSKTLTLLQNRTEWQIFTGSVEPWQIGSPDIEEHLIYTCDRPARAAAWLVINQVWTTEARLRIRPRPGRISLEVMIELLRLMTSMFGAQNGDKDPADSEKKSRYLLILNLQEDPSVSKINFCDLVYLSNWGELRHRALETSPLGSQLTEGEKFLYISEQIHDAGVTAWQDLSLFAHSGLAGKKQQNNLKVAFSHFLGGGRLKTQLRTGGSKPKLDVY